MKRIPVVHCIIQSVGSWADGKRLQVLSNRFQSFFQISITHKYLQVIYKIQQIVKITSVSNKKYSLLIRLYSKKLKRKIKCTEGKYRSRKPRLRDRMRLFKRQNNFADVFRTAENAVRFFYVADRKHRVDVRDQLAR